MIDRSLIVRDGMVTCPTRGDVAVEECVACAALIGLEGDDTLRVVCGYPLVLGPRTTVELSAGRRWARSTRARKAELLRR